MRQNMHKLHCNFSHFWKNNPEIPTFKYKYTNKLILILLFLDENFTNNLFGTKTLFFLR